MIDSMKETMRDAPGVGLAAPQVGLSLQLAVIEDREEVLRDLPTQELAEKDRHPVPFHVIINPQVTLLGNEKVAFYEGCLSLAGFSAVVPRARTVRVEYLDEKGEHRSVEASGWYARILQHVVDGRPELSKSKVTALRRWRKYDSIGADVDVPRRFLLLVRVVRSCGFDNICTRNDERVFRAADNFILLLRSHTDKSRPHGWNRSVGILRQRLSRNLDVRAGHK